MFTAFLTGFLLGISLILVIGAQNAFVLRQGILRQHIFYVVVFCALSDVLLISIGITGISFFFNNFMTQFSNILFGFSSIWLFIYGLIRLRSVFKSNSSFEIDLSEPKSLMQTLSIIAVLTFANPHVYLDTIVLLGTISMKFDSSTRLIFGLGATVASFLFFYGLAYGAKFIAPRAESPLFWKFVNIGIGFIMLILASWMFKETKIL